MGVRVSVVIEPEGIVGARGIYNITSPSHQRKEVRRGRKRRHVGGNCVGRKGWGLWQEGGKGVRKEETIGKDA